MKKYRLKKDLPTFDLPTFKAGDEFELSENGNLYMINPHPATRICAYTKDNLVKFPNILTDWFEEIPEQPKTIWDLEDGDKYFDIDRLGVISQQTWNSSFFDKQCRGIGNVFSTTKEAQKELAWRRAKQILLRDTKGFKPDWRNPNQDKYHVVYMNNYAKCKLQVAREVLIQMYDLWFATIEDTQASIKSHEKEWKIYLGVENA